MKRQVSTTKTGFDDKKKSREEFNVGEPLDLSGTLKTNCPNQMMGCRLGDSFYDVACEDLARSLIGKILVRRFCDGSLVKGRIVETECYPGGEDKASHSYNGKRTPRNRPMYMKPGTVYVYFTYGMYFCFNISSQGDGAAVLIRAADPLLGLEYMHSQRLKKREAKRSNVNKACNTTVATKPFKTFELCNGPAKLCISFSIDEKSCNMKDLSSWEELWIEADGQSEAVKSSNIITSKRIGIDSHGGEWVEKPLRFYFYGSPSVSRRDKVKEQEHMMHM